MAGNFRSFREIIAKGAPTEADAFGFLTHLLLQARFWLNDKLAPTTLKDNLGPTTFKRSRTET